MFVTFNCGHEDEIDIRFSSGAEKKAFLANPGKCSACRKADIAAKPRKTELTLPKLNGTPKQIAWAEQIRTKVITYKEEILPILKKVAREKTECYPEYIIRMLDRFIESETNASAWIEAFKPITSQFYSNKPAYIHILGGLAQRRDLFGLDADDANFIYDAGRNVK